MANEKVELTDEQIRNKREFIKHMSIMGMLVALVPLIFSCFWLVGNITKAGEDVESAKIDIIAEKLEIDSSEVIDTSSLLDDYETFKTSKGEYMAKFKKKDGVLTLVTFIESDD